MRAPQRDLRIEQLDAKVNRVRSAFEGMSGTTSWIRTIREALGMSTYALAQRAGVQQPAIVLAEQKEAHGRITLGTLSRYAAALECEVAHALVPRESLRSTLEHRIQTVARRMVERTAHSMGLEEQRPGNEALEHQVAILAHELRRELPRWLWEDR